MNSLVVKTQIQIFYSPLQCKYYTKYDTLSLSVKPLAAILDFRGFKVLAPSRSWQFFFFFFILANIPDLLSDSVEKPLLPFLLNLSHLFTELNRTSLNLGQLWSGAVYGGKVAVNLSLKIIGNSLSLPSLHKTTCTYYTRPSLKIKWETNGDSNNSLRIPLWGSRTTLSVS